MKSLAHSIIICISVLMLANKSLQGMYPLNLMRGYSNIFLPPYVPGKIFQFTAQTEWGLHTHAFDGNSSVNPLKIWTPTQNAIAMLKGFPADSPETALLEELQAGSIDELDNGQRGHFDVSANVKFTNNTIFSAFYHFPYDLTLMALLPIYSMRVRNVQFKDQTPSVTPDDVRVKTLLMDPFFTTVLPSLDPTLNLGPWQRTGLGDLALLLMWDRDFPQAKPVLKNVNLKIRGGLSIPTGAKKDEDRIFSMPYGYDGSAGLLFGGSIELTWFDLFRGGFDLDFLHLFGNTRNRRVKVFQSSTQATAYQNQTDLLFLAKVPAHKDFGFSQRFDLYFQALNVWRGFSGSIMYQFTKHGGDTISLANTNEFPDSTANSAVSLDEWTLHQAYIKFDYDFQFDCPCSPIVPQLSIFYRFPFNGKRSSTTTAVGAMLALSF